MDNLRYFSRVAEVPANAKKPIKGGRLAGFTDINPMWRIQMLTELFGASGEGWATQNVRYSTYENAQLKTVAVLCELELVYRLEDGTWSKPVYGVGGNTLVASESGGVRMDDDAWKKAYTDALSIACKALGFGANVYWQEGGSKYSPGEPSYKVDQPKANGKAAQKPEPVAVSVTKEEPSYPAQSVPKEGMTAAEYIKAELAAIRMTMQELADCRKALVDARLVPDIPTSRMTLQEAQELVRALRANYR